MIFRFFSISQNIVVQYYSSTVLQYFTKEGRKEGREGVDF